MSETSAEVIADVIAAFRLDVGTNPAKRVLRRHLTFGRCAMLSEEQHYGIREAVSDHFEMHPNEVYVVGSAKLGFSIVPDKRYRPFGDTSDIDLALISDVLFDRIWGEVYEYEKSQSSWATKGAFSKYFLRGWIRPDKLPPGASFTQSNEWFEFFRELTSSRRFGDVKIAAGLYRNWMFFEGYQEVCIEKCKQLEQIKS